MTTHATGNRPVRRTRRTLRLAALLVLLGTLVWLGRLPLLELLASRGLAYAGLTGHLAVNRFDPRGLTADLELTGSGERLYARMRVDYSPRGLMEGRLDKLVLSDLRLPLRITEAGIVIPPLPLPAGTDTTAESTAAPLLPPIGELVIERAKALVMLPDGTAELTADAHLTIDREAHLRIHTLTVSAVSGGRFAQVQADGPLHLGMGETSQLNLRGRLTLPGLHLSAGPGTLKGSPLSTGDAAELELPLTLETDALGVPVSGRLTARLHEASASAQLQLWEPTDGWAVIADTEVPGLSTTDTPVMLWVFAGAAGPAIVSRLLPGPLPFDGPAHLTLSARGALVELRRWLEQPGAPMTIAATLEGGADRLAQGARLSAQIPLQLRAEAGTLRATLGKARLEVDGADGWPPPSDEVPVRLPRRLRLAVDETAAPELVLTRRSDTLHGQTSGALTLGEPGHQPFGRLRWRVSAEANHDRGQIERVVVEHFEGNLERLELGEVALRQTHLSATGEIAVESGSGTLRLETRSDGRLPEAAWRDAGVKAPLYWRWEKDRLTLRHDGCIVIDWKRLQQADAIIPPGRLCLRPAEHPLLTLEARPDSPRMAGSGRLELQRGGLQLRRSDGSEVVAVGTPANAAFAWEWAPEERLQLSADGRLSEVRLAEAAVAVRGLEARLGPCEGTPSGPLCLSASANEVAHDTPTPWFHQLHPEIQARWLEQHIEFTGRLVAADTPLVLELEGRHRPAEGRGEASVRLQPLTLDRKDRFWERIAPASEGLLTSARGLAVAAALVRWDESGTRVDANGVLQRFALRPSPTLTAALGGDTEVSGGQVAVEAKVAMDPAELTSSGALLIENLDLDSPRTRVRQLNTLLRLSSLAPLRLEGRQPLSLALLDVGLPLTDGQAEFTLHPDGTLDVHSIDFAWGGGLVSGRDVHVDPSRSTGRAQLQVQDVELEQLLRLAGYEELSGTGQLAGKVHISAESGVPSLEHAELNSTGGGRLHYRTQSANGSGATAILLDALSDFRYEDLRLTAKGEKGGDTLLRFYLRGANPEYFDGYPVELTVNVKGRIGDLIQDELAGYQVPDLIRDRMSRFGQ